MHIIDSRFEIIKIIEEFLEDSQIISNIFRLFRKVLVVITNEELHKGNTTDKMSVKLYNRELKVIIRL